MIDAVQLHLGKGVLGHVRRKGSVYAVLVYEGRLSKRVEADGFFTSVIPAASLLGL